MHTTLMAGARGRRALAALGSLALAAAGLGIAAAPASAAEEVDDATFTWTINDEVGGGAYFGGCNFLSAGVAGSTGSSRLWTEADGFYQTQDGNVRVEKPTADGDYVTPTWETKCQNADGAAVGTQPGSTTETRFVFDAGSGTVDLEAGTASIQWDGSVTIVFYGGMTYWTVNDPQLTVEGSQGQITAIASGYGADMDDPSVWVELEPREVVLADLGDVTLDEDGFSVTPDYLQVEVEVEPGGPSGEQVRTGDHWGAFPQSLVDFNVETGQAAYWYSSGGAADPKKPTNPLTIGWSVDGGGGPVDPPPGGEEIPIEVEVPEDGDPGPEPGEFTWTINGSGAVNLGTAEQTAAGFAATGSLHAIDVTDTREDAPAWSISGQASAFSSGSDSFDAEALGWSPALVDNTVGAVPGDEVAPGPGGGLGTSRTLVSAPAGHDLGTVTVETVLDLLAPAGTPSGSYSSTLTLTALS